MSPPDPTQDRLTGAALRAMREGAELSQRALADAAGVHHSHISRFEDGQRAISPALRRKLAQIIADRLSGDAA